MCVCVANKYSEAFLLKGSQNVPPSFPARFLLRRRQSQRLFFFRQRLRYNSERSSGNRKLISSCYQSLRAPRRVAIAEKKSEEPPNLHQQRSTKQAVWRPGVCCRRRRERAKSGCFVFIPQRTEGTHTGIPRSVRRAPTQVLRDASTKNERKGLQPQQQADGNGVTPFFLLSCSFCW